MPPRKRVAAQKARAKAPLKNTQPENPGVPEGPETATAETAVPLPASRQEADTAPAAPAAAPASAPVAPAAAALPAQADTLEGVVVPNDPEERLHFYEAQIVEARRQLNADVEAFEDRLEMPLREMKKGKLYKHRLAADGKPFANWAQYVDERLPFSLTTADRYIVRTPLKRILGVELTARQSSVLHPIRVKHGKDKVLEVWNAASALGKPSPENLRIVRDQKGLGNEEEPYEEESKKALPGPMDSASKAIAQLERLPLDTIRSVSPDKAKELATTMRDLADKLEGTINQKEAAPA